MRGFNFPEVLQLVAVGGKLEIQISPSGNALSCILLVSLADE